MNRLLLLLMVFLCGCSRGASSSVFQLSGTVESVQVDIASQIPGQVLFLPEEGAAVKQGDVLVRIDAREYADRVKQAEAALVVAREAIRQSELNAAYRAAATDAAQRTASATVSGSESRVNEAEYARDQEAQAADAAVSEALARVSSAEHAVRQAEARLRETRVRAEHAERDRLRNEQLLGQGYIPPQRADTSRTEARAARQRVDEAVAAVGQARAQL
ncbi:MAG: biotin/lipoyl-binding protein, partial [Armatimonadetes bacterium]|nr:biotin/lipoyl-binding protein [Armatimonadota bacterium]